METATLYAAPCRRAGGPLPNKIEISAWAVAASSS